MDSLVAGGLKKRCRTCRSIPTPRDLTLQTVCRERFSLTPPSHFVSLRRLSNQRAPGGDGRGREGTEGCREGTGGDGTGRSTCCVLGVVWKLDECWAGAFRRPRCWGMRWSTQPPSSVSSRSALPNRGSPRKMDKDRSHTGTTSLSTTFTSLISLHHPFPYLVLTLLCPLPLPPSSSLGIWENYERARNTAP